LVDLAGIGQHPVQARLKDCDQPHIFPDEPLQHNPVQARLKDCDQPHIFPDEPLQHFLNVSHQQVQV
jgi:hypothetical protein